MEIILNVVYYVVPFIILLGILVFVHEFGHFIIARMLGVKVSAFSIGFGKELWHHIDKYGTNWRIAAIPLGGYCQFLGDADASSSTEVDTLSSLSDEDKKHAFALQKTWKKLAIVVAGPLFNYLFAIMIFISLFYSIGRIVYPSVVGGLISDGAAEQAGIQIGDKIISVNGKLTPDFQTISNEVVLAEQDNIKVLVERQLTIKTKAEDVSVTDDNGQETQKMLGILSLPATKNIETGEFIAAPAVVDNVVTDSAADKAGFEKGDILESINGVKLKDFNDLKNYVAEHINEDFEIKVLRSIVFDVTLKNTSYDTGNGQKIKRRMLGIQSSKDVTFTERDMPFSKAVKEGFKEAYSLTVTTLRSVGQMITGKRGGDEVGGIIRIAEMSGDISKTGGILSFIYFMALLSVNLGLINLLPIPVLDGGHVVIFIIEMITRRELKTEIKEYIFKFGLLLILGIMVLATWNDIIHLIGRWFDK